MNDNLHLELVHDEDRSLDFLNDDAYYDSIGEDRDGLGAARGFFTAFCGAVVVVVLVIEIAAVLIAMFG